MVLLGAVSMGIQGIVAERDFRGAAEKLWWFARHGWSERERLRSLNRKLHDPRFWNGGIVKLTRSEYRALPKLNRRVTADNPKALTSSILVWVEGRGLYRATRKH